MKQIINPLKAMSYLIALWFLATNLHAQSAQDVVNKHVEALGGKQAISKVKSIRKKQKIIIEQAGLVLESTVAMALPSRYKVVIEASDFMPGSVEVLNGSESVEISGSTKATLSELKVGELKKQLADFPSPLLHGTFKLLDKEIHQGKSCFVLQRADQNKYWIDAESYMLVKSVTQIYHQQVGEVSITSLFSQFAKVDDLYFAEVREIVTFDQRIEISGIEVNPGFSKDYFSTQLDALAEQEEKSGMMIADLPSPEKEPQEVFEKTKSYYAALENMQAAESTYQANPMFKSFYYEILATDLSIAGQPIKALKAMDKMGYAIERASKPIDFKKNKPVNALDEIVKLADQYQAIFINEAHHVPQHRAFTHQLLQRLYDKGYRYFAAETLMPEDTSIIRQKPYLTAYINEPEYADLIRSAVNIGYKIIPYEHVMELSFSEDGEEESKNIMDFTEEEQAKRIAKREISQATNLKQKIFDQDPNAKVLVHAGYDHIIEAKHMGFGMMANRFKEFTGIDPLTIDQVDMMEKSSLEFSSGYFQYVAKELAPTQYLALQKTDGSYWTTEKRIGKMDMQIFHPQISLTNGRPTWKSLGGKRKLKTIHLKKSTKGMAEVFVVGENNGVPIDRIYLDQPTKKLNFYLPKGDFYLKVTDENGSLVHEESIRL